MRVLIAAMLVLATLAFVPSAEATGDCIGKPGQVQACQDLGPQGGCAAVGLGLQGVRVCGSDDYVQACIGFNCETIYLG